MLAIKLRNVGKKHQRSFRFIVKEKRSKVQGKFIEDLGWYNPSTDKFEVNKDRAVYWLGVGAKPTMTVAQILKKSGVKLPEGIKTSRTYSIKKKEEEKKEGVAKPEAVNTAAETKPEEQKKVEEKK
ncbi:MAG: 30S ribosomal protein S16 [Candidatus Colwellbacteria bacterium]|nr:30S ribosomal protein S16 [Candidatus Colwellbacteria bacterium]